jgi:segregation and condensation protein B
MRQDFSRNNRRTLYKGGTNQGSVDARRKWRFIHLQTPSLPTRTVVNTDLEDVDEVEKMRRLEAVIFLSPNGLSSRKSAKLAGLADATEARTLIRKLNLNYDHEGRPYRIEEMASGFAILTRSHFASWLRRLAYFPGVIKLSQSAIETLAIVAYRQPVLRANIEAIRGVGCSEVLKQLMELDLVRISGRSEDLGRPYLYGTTKRFLQMFGLRSADRLPRMDWVNGQDLQVELNSLPTQTSEKENDGNDAETRESTVKMTLNSTAVLEPNNEHDVDEALVTSQTAGPRAAFDEDEDDMFFDDTDEDDDEEWDDDEEDDSDDEEDDDLGDDDESDWEEVDDEDSDEDSEEEDEDIDDEDDDDWEDDDDEDWDDDDDEEWD